MEYKDYSKMSLEDLKIETRFLEDLVNVEERKLYNNNSIDLEEFRNLMQNSEIRKQYLECYYETIRRYSPKIAKKDHLEMSKIADVSYGTVYTYKEYKDMCKTGYVSGYDGSGYYSDGILVYNLSASPRAFYYDKENTKFSHVVWFNK